MKRANAKRRVQDRKDYMARLREAFHPLVPKIMLLSPSNKVARKSKRTQTQRAAIAAQQSEPIRELRRSLTAPDVASYPFSNKDFAERYGK